MSCGCVNGDRARSASFCAGDPRRKLVDPPPRRSWRPALTHRHRLSLSGPSGLRYKPHNRWHPAIAPVLSVESGDEIDVEVADGLDGQLAAGPTALTSLDTTRAHPLGGPIAVRGANPGDLIAIEIVSIATTDRGFTAVRPGAGLMADEVASDLLIEWDLLEGVARSPALPGVHIHGAPFVGVVGVAPSQQRLRDISDRELALSEAGALVHLPTPKSARPPYSRTVADAGLRTIPPREIGGNLDVRHLQCGARVTLPVDVEGALLSVGDLHFAQGDGEVCGQAIETAGRVTIRVEVLAASAHQWKPSAPFIELPAYERAPPVRDH